ncbi:MAG: flagellar protein FlaG [Sulfurimicrobium sp.]|nr:flagellar protein FlaG [Sulfurimicrobium sp.]MDO9188824.1 flagellar protein FlaG [Sulfurimicrobium sp.]MDP1705786.1 flagellar protein FlaG [Sulfurimicrobium sp.]MDP1898655.1 flagellar protein FlaG [Sulfurimicrobium sp.]MDP2196968.1 flagellar protein FlaG [Sulfurimicrobium sp.]
MIIQSLNTPAQAAQPDRLVNNDGPKVVTDSAKPPAPQQLSSQNLKGAVDTVNQALRQSSHNLQISMDSETRQQIIKLVDTQTGELIRQIPSKEMLAIAHSIDQFLNNGQLLSAKA